MMGNKRRVKEAMDDDHDSLNNMIHIEGNGDDDATVTPTSLVISFKRQYKSEPNIVKKWSGADGGRQSTNPFDTDDDDDDDNMIENDILKHSNAMREDKDNEDEWFFDCYDHFSNSSLEVSDHDIRKEEGGRSNGNKSRIDKMMQKEEKEDQSTLFESVTENINVDTSTSMNESITSLLNYAFSPIRDFLTMTPTTTTSKCHPATATAAHLEDDNDVMKDASSVITAEELSVEQQGGSMISPFAPTGEQQQQQQNDFDSPSVLDACKLKRHQTPLRSNISSNTNNESDDAVDSFVLLSSKSSSTQFFPTNSSTGVYKSNSLSVGSSPIRRRAREKHQQIRLEDLFQATNLYDDDDDIMEDNGLSNSNSPTWMTMNPSRNDRNQSRESTKKKDGVGVTTNRGKRNSTSTKNNKKDIVLRQLVHNAREVHHLDELRHPWKTKLIKLEELGTASSWLLLLLPYVALGIALVLDSISSLSTRSIKLVLSGPGSRTKAPPRSQRWCDGHSKGVGSTTIHEFPILPTPLRPCAYMFSYSLQDPVFQDFYSKLWRKTDDMTISSSSPSEYTKIVGVGVTSGPLYNIPALSLTLTGDAIFHNVSSDVLNLVSDDDVHYSVAVLQQHNARWDGSISNQNLNNALLQEDRWSVVSYTDPLPLVLTCTLNDIKKSSSQFKDEKEKQQSSLTWPQTQNPIIDATTIIGNMTTTSDNLTASHNNDKIPDQTETKDGWTCQSPRIIDVLFSMPDTSILNGNAARLELLFLYRDVSNVITEKTYTINERNHSVQLVSNVHVRGSSEEGEEQPTPSNSLRSSATLLDISNEAVNSTFANYSSVPENGVGKKRKKEFGTSKRSSSSSNGELFVKNHLHPSRNPLKILEELALSTILVVSHQRSSYSFLVACIRCITLCVTIIFFIFWTWSMGTTNTLKDLINRYCCFLCRSGKGGESGSSIHLPRRFFSITSTATYHSDGTDSTSTNDTSNEIHRKERTGYYWWESPWILLPERRYLFISLICILMVQNPFLAFMAFWPNSYSSRRLRTLADAVSGMGVQGLLFVWLCLMEGLGFHTAKMSIKRAEQQQAVLERRKAAAYLSQAQQTESHTTSYQPQNAAFKQERRDTATGNFENGKGGGTFHGTSSSTPGAPNQFPSLLPLPNSLLTRIEPMKRTNKDFSYNNNASRGSAMHMRSQTLTYLETFGDIDGNLKAQSNLVRLRHDLFYGGDPEFLIPKVLLLIIGLITVAITAWSRYPQCDINSPYHSTGVYSSFSSFPVKSGGTDSHCTDETLLRHKSIFAAGSFFQLSVTVLWAILIVMSTFLSAEKLRKQPFISTRPAQLAFRVLVGILTLGCAAILIPMFVDLYRDLQKWMLPQVHHGLQHLDEVLGENSTTTTTKNGYGEYNDSSIMTSCSDNDPSNDENVMTFDTSTGESMNDEQGGDEAWTFANTLLRLVTRASRRFPYIGTASSIGPGKLIYATVCCLDAAFIFLPSSYFYEERIKLQRGGEKQKLGRQEHEPDNVGDRNVNSDVLNSIDASSETNLAPRGRQEEASLERHFLKDKRFVVTLTRKTHTWRALPLPIGRTKYLKPKSKNQYQLSILRGIAVPNRLLLLNNDIHLYPHPAASRFLASHGAYTAVFCLETACWLCEASWQSYYNPPPVVPSVTPAFNGSNRVDRMCDQLDDLPPFSSDPHHDRSGKKNRRQPSTLEPMSLDTIGLRLEADIWDESTDTNAFVCSNISDQVEGTKDSIIVIMFRGTSNLTNLGTDLRYKQVLMPRQLLGAAGKPFILGHDEPMPCVKTEEEESLAGDMHDLGYDTTFGSPPSVNSRSVRARSFNGADDEEDDEEITLGSKDELDPNRELQYSALHGRNGCLARSCTNATALCYSSLSTVLGYIPGARHALPFVHGGFLEAYVKIRSQILEQVFIVYQRQLRTVLAEVQLDEERVAESTSLPDSNRSSANVSLPKIYITGHSLGGALGQLFAIDFARNVLVSVPAALAARSSSRLALQPLSGSSNRRIISSPTVKNDDETSRLLSGSPRMYGTRIRKNTSTSMDDSYINDSIDVTVDEEMLVQPPIAVYTYGQPRVGNHAFARIYKRSVPHTFRVANEGDAFTTMPHYTWCGGVYKHAGLEVALDEGCTGNILVGPNVVETLFRFSKVRTSLAAHSLAQYRNALESAMTQEELQEYYSGHGGGGSLLHGGASSLARLPEWVTPFKRS